MPAVMERTVSVDDADLSFGDVEDAISYLHAHLGEWGNASAGICRSSA